MHSLVDKKSLWWKEPMVWLLIALPLSAVVGGGLTIWIAVKKADSLVSETYYKDGLAIHQVIERDARATALSLAAHVAFADGRLVIRLDGTLTPPPSRLRLTILPPIRAGRDSTVELQQTRNATYSGALADTGEGERRIILEPVDRSWRLAGRWHPAQSATVTLLPAAAQSPTRP